jgi:hypothetical protein
MEMEEMDDAPLKKVVVLGHVLYWRSGVRCPPMAGLGGEGRRWPIVFFSGVAGSWWKYVASTSLWRVHQQGTEAGVLALPLHLTAEGQPLSRSSTSIWRPFFWVKRWSWPSTHLQVVCPRRCEEGWCFGLIVGKKRKSSIPLLDLCAASAWRSPASGGEEAQALDCLVYFCARVLFVKRKALSLISRLFRVVELKGPSCNSVPAGFNCTF